MRNGMRARGEQLIALDTDRCPVIERARVAGKGGPASVDEIVAGMRSAMPFGSAVAPTQPPSSGISLPQISVPRATGPGISPAGPPSGVR